MKKAKLPRIYRFITDLRTYVFLASFFLLVAVGFAASDLLSHLKQKQVFEQQRQRVAVEIARWKDKETKYPNSRDVYFRLAVLTYQLGETAKAKDYLKKTLELDPNFVKGRNLEKLFSE